MNNLLDQYADVENEPPSESELSRLSKLASELIELEEQTEKAEKELKELKKKRHEMRTRTLPDAMLDVGVDRVGVPGAEIDVALTDSCHASIPKSWSDEKKQAAFEELRRAGGGDLVKNELVVSAGRGSEEAMRQITDRVRQMLAEYGLEASVRLEPSVQWNTLTSFVKSLVRDGEPVDLEAVGATYETVAKVTKKEK